MSDTARDYQTIETTSTEGLDQFFDVEMDEGQAVAGPALDEGQAVTLTEVAETLNITRRSALRLIHEGKLDGAKDGHGQWLVKTASIEKRLRAKNVPDSQIEPVAVCMDEGHGQGWTNGQAPGQHNGQDALVKELLGKLEVLMYRNGYLESQLSERQREIENHCEQIRLLTDNQHKGSRWASFKKWFFGQ